VESERLKVYVEIAKALRPDSIFPARDALAQLGYVASCFVVLIFVYFWLT
jgi:hypothetical protein